MATILRILILCSTLFFTKESFSQFNNYLLIREKLEYFVPKVYDSIVAYTFYRGGLTAPIPDIKSLNNSSHDRDAFLICFKNDTCFAICIAEYDSGIGISNRILIQNKLEIVKLLKAWPLSENESFLPFVYPNTENGKTSYDTLYALHPVYGNLSFKSREYYRTIDFPPVVTDQKAWDHENINYKYNSSLNLFIVFRAINDLYNSLIKQFTYQELRF